MFCQIDGKSICLECPKCDRNISIILNDKENNVIKLYSHNKLKFNNNDPELKLKDFQYSNKNNSLFDQIFKFIKIKKDDSDIDYNKNGNDIIKQFDLSDQNLFINQNEISKSDIFLSLIHI